MIAMAEGGQQGTVPPPPGIGSGIVRAGDPHGGKLFLQGRVQCGGTIGLFDDVVGRGFTLLSPTRDPLAALDPELAAWFASIGGLGAQIGPGAGVRDLDGSYARWFTDAGVDVVLQRPDFYVFGTATSAAETPTLVAALRSALANA